MGKRSNDETRGHAWAMLLTAHARLVERIEREFAEAGLPSLMWYDVLWELEKAPGRRLRMRELAAAVVLSRSNLTRLADRLADAGLLTREAVPDDRRGAYCVLTDAGRALRRRMWPVYRNAIDRLFASHVSEGEAAILSEVFERLVAALPKA